MVYGFDDINDDTYLPLSERIAAENTPGIYQRMLCDRCGILAALTQCGSTAVDPPLVPLMPGGYLTEIRTRKQLEYLADKIGQTKPKNLDDMVLLAEKYLRKWIEEGAVGIKIMSKYNLPPDAVAAEEAFKRMDAGSELRPDEKNFEVLENFLLHRVIDLAAEMDLVIAVHAGMWGDFRLLDSKFMLTLAPAHPQANFDLYHLGSPYVRDTIVIGKNLPNVFLNLCWTHIISQAQTCAGIDELLDQVPVNKVMAFGGDYGRPVEKVVGHLHMAREDFAQVFGRRIDRGMMSFEEAVRILKQWFIENPLRLYSRLGERIKIEKSQS
jgi:predicted TIM-barrel fold metal-dependent hydrolase